MTHTQADDGRADADQRRRTGENAPGCYGRVSIVGQLSPSLTPLRVGGERFPAALRVDVPLVSPHDLLT